MLTNRMVIIRLPKISEDRRKAYMRAAAREGKSLADFILDAADRAAFDLRKPEPKTRLTII